MSLRAITWAYEQVETKSTEKFVLVTLADNANDEGVCWPGRRHLAAKVGISVRQVTAHLAALEEKGLVVAMPRFRGDGSRASNEYRLPVSPPAYGSEPLGEDQEASTAPPQPASRHEPSVEPPKNQEASSSEKKNNNGTEEAREVVAYWSAKYAPNAKVDKKRLKRAQDRLDEDFTVERLKRAIDGAIEDEWLNGTAEKSTGYLKKFSTLLRDAEQVERLEDLALQAARRAGAEAHRDENELLDQARSLQAMHGWSDNETRRWVEEQRG